MKGNRADGVFRSTGWAATVKAKKSVDKKDAATMTETRMWGVTSFST